MKMKYRIWMLSLIAASITLSGGMIAAGAHQNGKSADQGAAEKTTEPTPPYHKSAEDAQPLPRLLPASDFSDRPMVARAYRIANEIPLVLAQQPCYCHCDRAFNHTSLLDCFASTHTAGCGICMAETFLAYRMTKQGKTPAEIRAAISRGDWKKAETKNSK
jgi:uncharacterized protein with PCYCGC motif